LRVPALEKELGIEVYATQSLGIGGRIRHFPEDFTVEETLVNGSKAEISSKEIPRLAGIGRYLVCALVKRNWDTLLAIKKVARRLGISRKRIQIAGLKDAKALTAQHITIQGITPEHVSQVRIKDINLNPLYFSDGRIFSQLLLGNQFKITIRGLSHTSPVVKQRVENVQTALESMGGFPNFYGHQRFGTVRPITHLVGLFLVKGDLEKAALTFLAQPSIHEHPESKEAREQLRETQDLKKALNSFPKYLHYERIMLSYLAKQPKDFVGAFRKLPLKLRRLFVQAYQSFLFNKSLSQRMKQGNTINEAKIGDYGLKIDDYGLPTRDLVKVSARSLQTVKEALNKGRVRLAIPLIGFKQPPSQGVQGEIEQEVLEKEKVKPQDFRVPSMLEVSAPGEFRSIVAPVLDLSFEEILKDEINPSKFKIRLSFMLQRGSYATVLLREFMKPRDLIETGF
jgi:tRNA pseudouridine13 synthase